MASAVAYIIQFDSTLSSSTYDRQEDFATINLVTSRQNEFETSSELTQCHIYPAQNPMPRGTGIETDDVEDFSDSPTNAPDLFDTKRYAYGRPTDITENFGSLDKDHGLLIKQRNFSVDSSIYSTQDGNTFYTSMIQEAASKTSSITTTQNILKQSSIDVEQFSFLLLATPVPFSIKNPVDSDVYIRLANHGVYPIASGTVSLKLDNSFVNELDSQAFFSGNGGFDVTWDNSEKFEYGEQIDVLWQFTDTAIPPNTIQIEYWFRTVEDRLGPRIVNKLPQDDAMGVISTTSIVFEIVDYESGVDISSLSLYVNNLFLKQEDLVILEIENGYRVQYSSPQKYVYGDTIPVSLSVSDLSEDANTSFMTWSFTIEGSLPPVVGDTSPMPCSTNVYRFKNISVEVIDGGHGLDKSSISVGIKNKTLESLIFIPIVRRLK